MGLKNAFPKYLCFFPETASLRPSLLFCLESSSCAMQQQGGGVWRSSRTPSLAVRPASDFLYPRTCWNHSNSSCEKASLLNTKNEWKTLLSGVELYVTHSPHQLRVSHSICSTHISLLWFQNGFSSVKSALWKHYKYESFMTPPCFFGLYTTVLFTTRSKARLEQRCFFPHNACLSVNINGRKATQQIAL